MIRIFTAIGTAAIAACIIGVHQAPAHHATPLGTPPHCLYGEAHGARGPQCSMPQPAHEITVRYTTQQPTCTAAQLGQHARIVGSGNDFQAMCRRNGPISTWDALR